MGWGKEWPSWPNRDHIKEEARLDNMHVDGSPITLTSLDLATGEKVVLTTIENGTIKHTDITKVYRNKVPTHDPYTNPDSHIYYQCDCGAILDPGTKSFAALNNAAMNAGWKVRWGSQHYQPYCVKCGEGIE